MQRNLHPNFPTPLQLGIHQLNCVKLSDLTTRDIAKIAAEAAETVIQGNMKNLNIGMGPPRDANHPLIATRRFLEWRVFLSHVQPAEVLKAGAALAALCRLPAQRAQFIRIRHHGEISERLPRVINPANFLTSLPPTGDTSVTYPPPEVVTAEYKLVAGIEWKLLHDLPQFRNCRTYTEFHAVTSAVENAMKAKFQIEYLRCYGGGGVGIRVDYRTFKNKHPGVVYIGYPVINDPDANLIAGYHPLSGIDYSTERLESEFYLMPGVYKI